VVGAGHYGIFSGRRWREKVYPVVRDFIANHQNTQSASKTDTDKVIAIKKAVSKTR
jgi:poly(3-hydroxybutyrate) depolymerase